MFAKCTSAFIAQPDDHTNKWHPPRRETERRNPVVHVQWVSVELLLHKDCPMNLHWQRVDMLRHAIDAWENHQTWDIPHDPQQAQSDADEDDPTAIASDVDRISDELTLCPHHPLTPSDRCGRCCVRTFDQLHLETLGEPEATNLPNKLTKDQHRFKQNPELQDQLQAIISAARATDLTDVAQRIAIARDNHEWVNNTDLNLPSPVTHLGPLEMALSNIWQLALTNKGAGPNDDPTDHTTELIFLDADTADAVACFPNAAALNFANPVNVGGGYLHGDRAPEEDLCRRIPHL